MVKNSRKFNSLLWYPLQEREHSLEINRIRIFNIGGHGKVKRLNIFVHPHICEVSKQFVLDIVLR